MFIAGPHGGGVHAADDRQTHPPSSRSRRRYDRRHRVGDLVRSVITVQGETIRYLQQDINGQYQG